MAASTGQRIGIWVMAILMLVGTLGSFFVFVLEADQGPVKSSEELAYEKQLEEYQKQMEQCPAGNVDEKKIEPAPDLPVVKKVEEVSQLKTDDIKVGTGSEVKPGDCVEVLFHGTLAAGGEAFEGGSNYAEGVPYRSGQNGFVPGFSEGLLGMKVGGERRIYMPSDLAYGDQESESIPANSDLIFVVSLVGIYQPPGGEE